jgi:histidine ammonia-lyase
MKQAEQRRDSVLLRTILIMRANTYRSGGQVLISLVVTVALSLLNPHVHPHDIQTTGSLSALLSSENSCALDYNAHE